MEKKKRAHTERGGFTLLSQLMTRRHVLLNVPSDQKSSSLHSAVSSTDALISCSVFLCSAGLFFYIHHFCERLFDPGRIFRLLTLLNILPVFSFNATNISWTNGLIGITLNAPIHAPKMRFIIFLGHQSKFWCATVSAVPCSNNTLFEVLPHTASRKKASDFGVPHELSLNFGFFKP